MSLCGICYSEIEDGKPKDMLNLSYDGCESSDDELKKQEIEKC